MTGYSANKIRNLLDESDGAQTADEKGEKLELLACYLFQRIQGVEFYTKDYLDGHRAHEIDVVFNNDQRFSPLYFLDPLIIVECKNTTIPIGSEQVRWFIEKIRDVNFNYGILVSLGGITGSPETGDNAISEINNAFKRDGTVIILIIREEILSLSKPKDLVNLVRGKWMQAKLARTVV